METYIYIAKLVIIFLTLGSLVWLTWRLVTTPFGEPIFGKNKKTALYPRKIDNNTTEINRLVLNKEDFTNLVSGKTVKIDNTEFILQDIGWSNMLLCIYSAWDNTTEDL